MRMRTRNLRVQNYNLFSKPPSFCAFFSPISLAFARFFHLSAKLLHISSIIQVDDGAILAIAAGSEDG